jgi:hypothetical protein
MFGWFKPTCPCDPAAKRWIEERLRWLVKQFCLHILLERPVVLPDPEFFPDAWDESTRAVRLLFRRVCGYMLVDPNRVELELFNDKTPGWKTALDPSQGFAAGTWEGAGEPWEKGKVRIERGGLDRPADLIGVMAHELAHQKLLGERRADAGAFDNELLTDLTAIFFGFGVFLANNPRKATGELGRWPGTKLYKPEYISEPMMGYALAHIAWFRDEERSDWVKHLRWTPRGVFTEGLRYLQKTGDSSFVPVRLNRGCEEDDEPLPDEAEG